MTNNKLFYQAIKADKSDFKIWEKLENGCFIATMNYSEENVPILMTLLQSFAEQYGEEITYESASDELKLYTERGKLFLYLDENMNPVSMNGVTYNEDNVSVDFKSLDDKPVTSAYFYGLSTVHEYRGKGACRTLINFAINYACANDYDVVYARTDLVNSNSEWIMQRAGMQICEDPEGIITEWVDVADGVGDYRLHLWLPLKEGLYLERKPAALNADSKTRKITASNAKVLYKKANETTSSFPALSASAV